MKETIYTFLAYLLIASESFLAGRFLVLYETNRGFFLTCSENIAYDDVL